jgi:hypothetical protein
MGSSGSVAHRMHYLVDTGVTSAKLLHCCDPDWPRNETGVPALQTIFHHSAVLKRKTR